MRKKAEKTRKKKRKIRREKCCPLHCECYESGQWRRAETEFSVRMKAKNREGGGGELKNEERKMPALFDKQLHDK